MTREAAVSVDVEASDGAARATTVTTARGPFATPCFMPVGTRGAVRTLAAADLEALGARVVLANTYHLMLRPGADVIAALGGLHGFTGFTGHMLTDSGGFQVFSLGDGVVVDDEGVTFRSTYDGSTHRLTPEDAVAVQAQLGADIQMVLDVCTRLPAEPAELGLAVDRTAQWAARARAAHTRAHETQTGPERQALFGIVQGGVDPALRVESAHRTVELDFDGYGIGGLSVGESRDEMVEVLGATISALPADRPRYLMGVGDPAGLAEAVGLGVDMFDCVLPTRLARHGTVLTSEGRWQIRNAARAGDGEPLDPACGCSVCARHSRAYLRHLHMVEEPVAARLLTIHNLAFTFDLVGSLRSAIVAGTFAARRAEVLATWA
jgi:queuine tRNA-ribosyltransferase